MKKYSNLAQLLNLNYLRLTNKTVSCGSMDLPAIDCNIEVMPDFIALYSEPGLYHKTPQTAVAFYEYDAEFDGKNGLYWAIYHNDEQRLAEFKARFQGVRYMIIPDYSELGDIHRIENDYRLFKGRIVGLWFLFMIGAVAIPNITLLYPDSVNYALSGYENCSVVAISSKGHMDNPDENHRLRANIRLAVDRLPKIKSIIVYDVCGTDDKVLDAFSYASNRGIRVVIPDNTLKNRNRALYAARHLAKHPGKAVTA